MRMENPILTTLIDVMKQALVFEKRSKLKIDEYLELKARGILKKLHFYKYGNDVAQLCNEVIGKERISNIEQLVSVLIDVKERYNLNLYAPDKFTEEEAVNRFLASNQKTDIGMQTPCLFCEADSVLNMARGFHWFDNEYALLDFCRMAVPFIYTTDAVTDEFTSNWYKLSDMCCKAKVGIIKVSEVIQWVNNQSYGINIAWYGTGESMLKDQSQFTVEFRANFNECLDAPEQPIEAEELLAYMIEFS